MPVDVAYVQDKVETGEIEEYYGFDPDSEYVIRAKNRDYQGTTQKHYQFVAGQVIAGPMYQTATEEQKWNRGERLAWFLTAPGYVLYKRGEEPPRDREPLWSELPPESSEETGEAMTGEMSRPATWPAAPPKNEPRPGRLDANARPVTSYPIANDEKSGEATPKPTVTRTPRPRAAKAPSPTASAPTADAPPAAPTPPTDEAGATSGEGAPTGEGVDGPGPSFAFPQA